MTLRCSNGKQKTPVATSGRGFRARRTAFGLVSADVDGAERDAVRREHAAGHVAAVIAATAESDAEAKAAMAPVVMRMPDEPARRSGGGSQRHGAEGSCGNKRESYFAKHGRLLE